MKTNPQIKVIGSKCYYLSGIHGAKLLGPAHICQNPTLPVTIKTTSTPPEREDDISIWASLKQVPWIKQLLQQQN